MGCYTLPFAPDGGQAPTGETDPFLDKIPWPVRQKEASQVTLAQLAIPAFPAGPHGCYLDPSIAPLNPLCSVYTSAGGGDVT